MNSRYKQTGISVNLSGALVNAAQMARKNLQHLGETDNARVKAMAAANIAWSSYKAIQTVDQALSSDPKTLINLSISGGSQHSASHQKKPGRHPAKQPADRRQRRIPPHLRQRGWCIMRLMCAACRPAGAPGRVPANLRSNRAMAAHRHGGLTATATFCPMANVRAAMPASFFSNPHCATTTTSPCTACLTTGTGGLAATSRATAALLWEFALGACPTLLRKAGKRQDGAGHEAQHVGNVGYAC